PEGLEYYESRHRGGYLLELRREEDEYTLGFIALRPRISAGAWDLVEKCERLGVKLELLQAGSPVAAEVVGARAGVPVAPAPAPGARHHGDVDAIRERQRAGAVVAFVSDSAEAAEAFAACDLAVGLADGRGDFPARADLLAPDLRGVADLLEAGALRAAAIRDGVRLSLASNGIGAALGLVGGPLGPYGSSTAVYVGALGALAVSWT